MSNENLHFVMKNGTTNKKKDNFFLFCSRLCQSILDFNKLIPFSAFRSRRHTLTSFLVNKNSFL